MAFETRDNSGVLFRETGKTNEKAPDYKGKATIGGVEYRISAWVKEGRSGGKFLSLAFEGQERADFVRTVQGSFPGAKEVERVLPIPPPRGRLDPVAQRPLADELDDEIPF